MVSPRNSTDISALALGKIVATPNAISSIPPYEIHSALRRHISKDWGEVGEEDWAANEEAFNAGFRILSVYKTATGVRFWIITEADRSVTTVLMPEDY